MHNYVGLVAEELGLGTGQVEACAALLAQEATVPFIARYRKEATGGLDEVKVTSIRDRLEGLRELNERREAILKSLSERELLAPELKERLDEALSLSELEDIYLPYRPKRKTRASMARERGLEPLALRILEQRPEDSPLDLAREYLDPEKGLDEESAALSGARDILAELFCEDEAARKSLRELFSEKATVKSRVVLGQEEKGDKYRDYFDREEGAKSLPSHRYLALRRAEGEGVLALSVQPDPAEALSMMRGLFLKNDCPSALEVEAAIADSYKRLLSLQMETEARLALKKRADREAIAVFAENLHELLMAAPLGGKSLLAIDPGFRTGCKAAALSESGTLLEYRTVQPHASDSARESAGKALLEMIKAHKLEAVAIGDGTAGRETEAFVKGLENLPKIPVVLVSESGASIYSASEEARSEFPDLDLTIRGAISIGRRLMDPLAELVKIDPKSIGVGQYQHDVDQSLLKTSLDDVVVSCVNQVGVEANTASEKLLSYVSGLGPGLARNIVKFREQNGPFRSRKDFLRVPRLGPKAFEQCAGFLRIGKAENPLDESAVHPESYFVVERMAADLGATVSDLMKDAALRSKIKPVDYADEKIGLPTLEDIMEELAKPGRDPRKTFSAFAFAEGLSKLEDLKPGMRLPGKITNVTAFGAFVDVGVHTNGLVHLSELSDRFVKVATEAVRVGQEVTVTVLSADPARNRLSLSLKSRPGPAPSGDGHMPGQNGPGSRGGTKGMPKPKAPEPFNNPFAALKRN
jgi:uncharacterized protein